MLDFHLSLSSPTRSKSTDSTVSSPVCVFNWHLWGERDEFGESLLKDKTSRGTGSRARTETFYPDVIQPRTSFGSSCRVRLSEAPQKAYPEGIIKDPENVPAKNPFPFPLVLHVPLEKNPAKHQLTPVPGLTCQTSQTNQQKSCENTP